MMKKLIILAGLMLGMGFFASAQPDDDPPEDNKKLEPIIIAIISRDLNLNEDEARKFWPIFNSYKEEMKQLRRNLPKDELDRQRRVLEIRQKYRTEFGRALPPRKVNRYFQIEGTISQSIRNEMKQRRQNRVIRRQ